LNPRNTWRNPELLMKTLRTSKRIQKRIAKNLKNANQVMAGAPLAWLIIIQHL
jgi:hypothetical protein